MSGMPQPADDTDADEAPPLDPPARAPRPLWTIGLAVVLAIALATVVVQWRYSSDLDRRVNGLQGTEATRRDIAQTAGAFGEALLSYDYNDLNAARTRVLALATDSFGQQYTTAFTGGLDGAITKLKATSKATVDSVYISDAIGDTAKAVVTLDSE